MKKISIVDLTFLNDSFSQSPLSERISSSLPLPKVIISHDINAITSHETPDSVELINQRFPVCNFSEVTIRRIKEARKKFGLDK